MGGGKGDSGEHFSIEGFYTEMFAPNPNPPGTLWWLNKKHKKLKS
jgi:hypothetical protein